MRAEGSAMHTLFTTMVLSRWRVGFLHLASIPSIRCHLAGRTMSANRCLHTNRSIGLGDIPRVLQRGVVLVVVPPSLLVPVVASEFV